MKQCSGSLSVQYMVTTEASDEDSRILLSKISVFDSEAVGNRRRVLALSNYTKIENQFNEDARVAVRRFT